MVYGCCVTVIFGTLAKVLINRVREHDINTLVVVTGP